MPLFEKKRIMSGAATGLTRYAAVRSSSGLLYERLFGNFDAAFGK